MQSLEGKTVCCCVDFAYEDLELWYPKLRLEEEGAKVLLVGTHPKGMNYASQHGYPAVSDLQIDELDPNDIDAVLVPGGFAPDSFVRSDKMKALVVELFQANRPIAAIGHGPWMLCSAELNGKPIINGLRCTCIPAVKDDVENAGGIFEDSAVVVDRKVITSRTPNDLVPFVQALIREIQESGAEGGDDEEEGEGDADAADAEGFIDEIAAAQEAAGSSSSEDAGLDELVDEDFDVLREAGVDISQVKRPKRAAPVDGQAHRTTSRRQA
ncbi:unnamed protein product [Polarella glacialis]|uniref:DJ-1/PfpI domain-containing protein n=1 Tax=Polarella glacialis TaxID=89957 RepID=A0A813KXC1_POLGL|nr:unnamed protein product [Polarella glacialis]